MTIQLSGDVRDDKANQFEASIGTSPRLEIRSGPPPANPAASDSGVLLAEITLPSDWLNPASGGNGQISGLGLPWEQSTPAAAGTAGHFRLKSSGGTCHMQGTAGTSGDLVLSSDDIVLGEPVRVTAFQLTEGGA